MEKELKELTDYAQKLEGKKIQLQNWDYSYYANKLKTRSTLTMTRNSVLTLSSTT